MNASQVRNLTSQIEKATADLQGIKENPSPENLVPWLNQARNITVGLSSIGNGFSMIL